MNSSILSFTAEDNTEVFYNYCKPSFPVKSRGVILILHGMGEYKERYQHTSEYLCSKGFLCIIPDLRGHGQTAPRQTSIDTIIEDIRQLQHEVENEHPNLAVFILGHSFGSFIALQYSMEFGQLIKGVILAGTGGISQLKTFAGLFIAGVADRWNNSRKLSSLLNFLCFADFNRRIKQPKTFFDWVCSDEQVVKEFIDHQGKGLSMYSSSFYIDLIKLLKNIHSKVSLRRIPKNTSILMISGTEDPVGRYGKEVKKLYSSLRSSGNNDVSIKLYKGARHEILNEPLKDEVFEDIMSWLNIRL